VREALDLRAEMGRGVDREEMNGEMGGWASAAGVSS
jgi:hypothetical protein